ncbi:aspartate/glutamate racemase family protein [Sporosarcina ureilytica]|uniref:Aspartate racemase n=1 Tax=Sporosarcina ureilytica TaxID=298596 RepID=A0A1D8JK41_9BACL|nr:amino acid racemase [Sporosarcina ureilytica]AOV09081.1 aspartate racemase [Sporosarcina ureilytica]
MKKKMLGIIGGVGPLATMFIGEIIVRRTAAEKDQDHVNMVITNNTNIPDRTAFILGESLENPVPVIVSDAKRLQEAGAEILAMPCNTAHSFLDEIQQGTELQVIDMIRETAMRAKEKGARRVGILGTTGTISTGIYQGACERLGMEAVVPDDDVQAVVMSLIYDDIKAGQPADPEKWAIIRQAMKDAQCDEVILGCTELSIVSQELQLKDCIDSLLVLAETAIQRCGYKVK